MMRLKLQKSSKMGPAKQFDCPGTHTWGDFFELSRHIEVPPDFMAQRELNTVPSASGVFDSFVSDATPGSDTVRLNASKLL